MNGIALLLLTATVGVEYDWRTLEDGQIEYVLIIEPDLIPSLAEGSEISSSVPAELESIQRICIRIAQPSGGAVAPRPETPRSLPANSFRTRIGLRATEPTTMFWKAKGQPEETANVRYGWQPTKEGLQQYFVQIDPKFLRTLAPGDEIYTNISTEAGRVDTFVVFSNAKQLPRVAGKPLGNALAGTNTGAALPGAAPPAAPRLGPAATFGAPNPLGPAPLPSAPLPSAPLAASSNPPTFGPLSSAPPAASSSTLDRPPAFANPNAFGGVNDVNSRVNPVAGYETPAAGPTFGSGFPAGAQPNLNAPNPSAPLASSTGYANEGYRNDGFRGTEGYRGNELRQADPRDQFAQQNDPYRNPPVDQRNDLFPAGSGSFASNNPAMNPAAPGLRNTAAPLPNSSLQNPGSNMPGSAPYRPGVGYPQDAPTQPAAYDNRGYAATQPAVDYRPTTPDNQLASRDVNTLRPGTRNDATGTSPAAATPEEKPWWPLVLMAFGLFVSIGANFYLGWTAAEFYSRYKLAVERLRTSSRV